MKSIRFNQLLSGRNVEKTMHSAVSIAFIGTLFAGAAMVAGTELPDLGGGMTSFANAVNDKGDIVGRSFNSIPEEHATVWLAGGAPKDLGTLGGYRSEAKAVSSNGMIVGWSYLPDLSQHAVLWSSATSAPVDLGTLGGVNSAASGVNLNGDVVGLSHVPDNSTMQATLWPAGTHAAEALSAPNSAYSQADAINLAGDIVGTSLDVNWTAQAILWTGPTHTPIVLQTLGGTQAHAFAINDKGDIVGTSLNSLNVWRPTLWAAPTHAPTDLGTPLVGSFGSAAGINAVGDVVGYAGVAGGSKHATLWQMASASGVPGVPSTCKLSASSKSLERSRSDDRGRSEERRRAEERERDRQWLGLSSSSSARSAAAPSTSAPSVVPSSSTGSRTMVDLGVLAGSNSQATSVNPAGKIVGYGDNTFTESRAMSWQATPSVPVTVPPTGTPGRDHEGNHENHGQEDGDC